MEVIETSSLDSKSSVLPLDMTSLYFGAGTGESNHLDTSKAMPRRLRQLKLQLVLSSIRGLVRHISWWMPKDSNLERHYGPGGLQPPALPLD